MQNSKPKIARRRPKNQKRYLETLKQLERRATQDPPPDHPRWLANCINNLTKRAEKKAKRREQKERQKERSARKTDRIKPSKMLQSILEAEQ